MIDKSTWKKVKLGDIAEEISVRIDNPSNAKNDRFVGLEHFVSGDLTIRSWGSTESLISSMKEFKQGDVLFARRNVYLKRASLVEFDGLCSGDAIVLREKDNYIVKRFLPFILNTKHFWAYANANADGSMSKRINVRALLQYEFLLPPIEEQKRVAELLWTADEVIVKEKILFSDIKKLRSSFVNEIIRSCLNHGELFPLAELIQDDRPITYGILKPGLNVENGIPVIKVKDFPNGYIVNEGLLLTSKEIEIQYKRSRLCAGDILISIRGTVGRLAEVPKELENANITQDTARLSFKEGINKQFIRAVLESSYVQNQIITKITGMAVKGINIGELRKVMIPLPNSKVQEHFERQYNAISAAMNINRETLANAERVLSDLMQFNFSSGGAN